MPVTTGRLVGLAALAVVSLSLLCTPAAAVGASGVDMTPALPRDGEGTYVLTVGGGGSARLVLTNLTDEPRTVRVSAASAEVGTTPGSGVVLGPAGSLPWLPLDERLTLEPNAAVELPIPTDARRGDLDGVAHVAFVLEVSPSASLVTQAVTVVAVRRGARLPIPTGLLVTAVVLLLISATAWARARTDRHVLEPV